MKRFIKLILLYVAILFSTLFIMLEVSSTIVKSRNFRNHETESNLLVMKTDEKYDVLFMGISHARNFSRHKNHLRVENILKKKIINIGQGSNLCGINEQLFYLDYFYDKGNSVETVVYFISPPLFFSETLPMASNTFNKEPFDLSFTLKYLTFNTENKGERLSSYFQSKLSRFWLSHKPYSMDSKDEQLDRIDIDAVSAGQRMVYNDSIAFQRFNKSIHRVEETIQLALKHNSDVVLIIPPALFGKWEGHSLVEEFARQMTQQYDGVEFYDFSESVLTPEYYYDHHHLNTNGVVLFTTNNFKPILDR